ncbi:MAG: PqqD family peptide modification chaperone [Dehalogenimonas sp.]
MKVLLIFPPQFTPFRPHLGLPSITAYLRSHQIDVTQRDLNVETYDLILSKEYLLSLGANLTEQFATLDSRAQLSPSSQKYYNDLFIATASLAHVAAKVEGAKEILRGNGADFYDPGVLFKARQILEQALAIVSIAHLPTTIGFESLEMPSFDNTLEGIQFSTNDNEHNPFLGIFVYRIVPDIVKSKPDVIGISITSRSQLISSLTLSRLLKKALPKIHIVFGGNIVTLLADSFKNNEKLFGEFLDSAVLYEGEKPMLALAEHIRDRLPLNDVPNLIYRDETGVRTTGRCLPEAIDSLPTPDFEGLPLKLYLSPEPVLPLLASRGCYWTKCAFCSQNFGFGECYHKRNTHLVVEDIRKLSAKYNTSQFAFVDEAISPGQIEQLADEIINTGLNIRCSTNIRMEKQFTSQLCQRIATSGFKLLYLGLESGSDRVLQLMNKGITTDTAQTVCRNVHGAGIWNHLYVMFGFPGETIQEAQDTISFLLDHKSTISSFHTDNFSLERGMIIEREPERFGVTVEKNRMNDFSIAYSYSLSQGISYLQARQLSDNTMDEVGTQFDGNKVLELITHYYLPLFLSHYEASDPSLKNIKLADNAPIKPATALGPGSIPIVNTSTRIWKTNFDLINIRCRLGTGQQTGVLPEPSTILFDSGSKLMVSIPGQATEILELCNGRRTVREIALILGKTYDAPVNEIEKGVLILLNSLVKSGFMKSK